MQSLEKILISYKRNSKVCDYLWNSLHEYNDVVLLIYYYNSM